MECESTIALKVLSRLFLWSVVRSRARFKHWPTKWLLRKSQVMAATPTMKAVVLTKDFKLEPQARPILVPKEGQVRIQIAASALNRRDYWITQKLYPGIKARSQESGRGGRILPRRSTYFHRMRFHRVNSGSLPLCWTMIIQVPVILGSDCCGIVVEAGKGVASEWLGKTVVVNPTNGWPSGELPPAMHDLVLLGMPMDGAFAEYVVVDVSRIHMKPTHLSDVEAAAVPLAGVTAYRALFKLGLAKKGCRVFVSGIGSGVSTFAAQFAASAGCFVVVSSSSQDKLDEAIARHSLAGGVLYTQPAKEWSKQALALTDNVGFDVVIDGAGGPEFNALLHILRPGGRLVSYGATAGKPKDLDIFRIFLLQLKLLGTSMGSDDDFTEMLKFVDEFRIKPVISDYHPWEVRYQLP